jgi:thiosulfate/3-mercaptopyruvate sulfurtransferase
MKSIATAIAIIALFTLSFTYRQTTDPWKPAQVMKTADLAKILNDPKAVKPVIINVGPMGSIKGAVTTGAANSPEGLQKFKTEVTKYKKDQVIVIYCGCCSMQNCPNIRETFMHLQKEGFKNPRVLDIPTGLTEDWSGKGYPMD